MKIRLWLLLIIIAPAMILTGLWIKFHDSPAPPIPDRTEAQQKIIQEIMDKTASAIVQIPSAENQTAGFFIRPDYLVTFYKSLPNKEKFYITTADGKQYDAEFFSADPATGLAILQIPGGSFPYLKFAPAQSRQPGVKVIAAVPGQAKSGIISGIRGNMIMTDTATFADSTGCPLLNLQGEVLGINQATRKNEVLSSELVQRVADKLIHNGFIECPILGILASDTADGVMVRAIAPRSPAADSLAPGDIIQKANEKEIKSAAELRQIIHKTGSGKEIFLEIRRKDRTLSGGLLLQKSTRNWFRHLAKDSKEPLEAL